MRWERLSPRTRQVAKCLLDGMDNREISEHLGMTLRTVKAHMHKMFLLYDIHPRYIKRVRLVYLLTKEIG